MNWGREDRFEGGQKAQRKVRAHWRKMGFSIGPQVQIMGRV